MIIVVSGSRSITSYEVVKTVIENSGFQVDELIHGHQNGKFVLDPTTGRSDWFPTVDLLSEKWAKENGVPVKRMPAEWNKFGLGAGSVRNNNMILYAIRRAKEVQSSAGAIFCHDGTSKGTIDCLNKAKWHGVQICKATCRQGNIEYEWINTSQRGFSLA
jgi:hypothetical protein